MRLILSLLVTLLAGSSADAAPALPAKAVAPNGLASTAAAPPAPVAPITYPQALILIRSTLAALQHADETGNYATLQALGNQSFRASNSAEKLAQAFAPLRPYNVISVLILEPKFTLLPVLRGSNLVMAGFFANEGYHINFQLAYGAEGGRWHLSQINVGIQSAK